ncbi:MAG: cadherin domain-containing protein, partial [Proteobacteria bacterium]|nr:cadherin domain-containing protein [Pseudomonadota bacterium]
MSADNASTTSSTPNSISVGKPAAGQTEVVALDRAQSVSFDFNKDAATFELRDVDLVIHFPDGATIVLLGFGLKLIEENPAELTFDGQPIDPQMLLSLIGKFVASDVPLQSSSSAEAAKTVSAKAAAEAAKAEKDAKVEEKKVEVVVEVQAEPNNHKADSEEDDSKKSDADFNDNTSTAPIITKKMYDEPPSTSASSSSSSKSSDATGPGNYDIPVPEITAKLFGIVDHQESNHADGLTVRGALALDPADTDESYAVQAAVDTITGTSGSDEIYADDPTYAGYGNTSRSVEFEVKMPNASWDITGVKVSGLPDGYSIVGAQLVDGSYVIPINPDEPEKFTVALQYVLPVGATPNEDGFYSFFSLKFDFDIENTYSGSEATTSGTVLFGIRDVNSEAEAEYEDPLTERPIYVLWSKPPGSIVNGGAGDDVIMAGAGNDILTGGSGDDVLSYRQSNAAVNVDLESNTVSGGYAQGDTISGFEGVEGSRFADELRGTTGDNILAGGAGADILDGRAGNDTARYDNSTDGVTVNLVTGTGSGGDAQGDTLISIENIAGSGFADVLIGDGGDNQLYGLAGNDRLVGGAGGDLLDGGAGTDTADYSGGASGIVVDLAAGVGSAGDAMGDQLISIEKVIGSAFDDQIFGSATDETLVGGDGDDLLDGRDGNDTLQGGTGNDVLRGGAGADALDGGAGIDTADYATSGSAVDISLTTRVGTGGDAEGDTFSGIENLTGSAYDDRLIGDGAANVLSGGAGNDTLSGGAGADTLDGGTGNDTADYATSTAAVTVDLELGTGSGGDAAGDTLIGIENVMGSTLNDTLRGDSNANILSGGAGNDTLSGGAGADTLDGGDGLDTATYATSNAAVQIDLGAGTANGGDAAGDTLIAIENVTGSAFDDTLTGDAEANVLNGGAGDDLLDGGDGADTLQGGSGTDTVTYATSTAGVTIDLTTGYGQGGFAAGDRLYSIERLIGSAFNDNMTGDVSDNQLFGGDGDDTLQGGAGADLIDGGAGFDTTSYATSTAAVTVDLSTGSASGGDADGDTLVSIEAVYGSNFDDTLKAGAAAATLSGGAGDDTLIGGASADTLLGGSGDDFITGGLGADRIDGGSGVDTASYSDSTAAIQIDLANGTATGGTAAGDILLNVENIIGTDFGDTLTGNSAANALTGGLGNDTLTGGAGADILDGGDGVDTADYSGSGLGVTVNMTTGSNFGGDAQGDTLIAIERILGSAFADTITGAEGDDTLIGNDGNDVLSGAAGNDRLEGGLGNDTLAGGAGADVLDGGDGIDTADYSTSSLAVQVNLQTGLGVGGDAQGDTLTAIENVTGSALNDVLIGNVEANMLTGGDGNDRLEGAEGDDILIGGAGDDILIGGAGADVLQGGAGDDMVDYSASSAGVSVNLVTQLGSGGDATGDSFSSIESITGSAYNDVLTGNSASNTIFGGLGNDIINGGAGADTLHGGDGYDVLTYATSSGAVNVNLETQTGTGGDAQGDTLDGFEELIGSAFDDTLTGSTGADTLRGGAGNDTLIGGAGADTLDGGTGTDIASYANAAAAVQIDLSTGTATGSDAQGDTFTSIEGITGSNHDDWIKASSTGSILDGGAGNDTMVSGAGADTLTGGTGRDTVDYSESTAGVNVNLTTGSGSGGFAQGDVLAGLEDVIGSGHADRITGNASDNRLQGGAGDDVLSGLGGADILDGGDGVDTADYSASVGAITINFAAGTGTGGDAEGDTLISIENVLGSAQADTFLGDANTHAISGQGGDDLIMAGAGAEAIDGGSGFDTVNYSNSTSAITIDLASNSASGGYAAGDTLTAVEAIIATAYNDTLIGNSSANTLTGGAGNDTIRGGAGADTLDGGTGEDTLDYSTSSAGVNVSLDTGATSGGDATGDIISNFENIKGSVHADTLTGDSQDNRLDGGAGDDVLIGLGGADRLDGGTGNDTADYSASTSAINVDLDLGTASGGDAAGDTLISIENITGSAFNDRIAGDNNANILNGGAGDDVLVGSLGADTMIGGSGNDTAEYSTSDAAIVISLDGSAGTGGQAAGDVLQGVENITGSDYDDTLTGDSGANILKGGAGADTLFGGAGNDRLEGGDDDDRLVGGAGADELIGGAGTDTADYATSGQAININLAAGTASGGDAEGDTLTGIENITGSAHDDVLTALSTGSLLSGGAGDDTLTGGAGDDTLLGGSGADLLEGREGADTIDGGSGNDTVTYASSSLGVTVDLTLSTAQISDGDAAGDVITSVENVIGSAFDDRLTGNTSANILNGGAGNDTLDGGLGADQLIGGAGTDTADYTNSTAAVTVNLTTNANTGGYAQGDVLSGIENITGSAHNDRLTGDAGANVISGGGGDDILAGLGGADVLDGGSGSNTADYSASGAGVAANLASFSVGSAYGVVGTGGHGGDAEGDTYVNIQNLIGSIYADTLVAGATGGSLAGGAGDDILIANSGADIIDGGSGSDQVYYGYSNAAVNINLANGTASGGYATGDVLTNIENVFGTSANDTITGNANANTIWGSTGNDTIEGLGGADTLDGGTGNDTVSYANSNAGVTVDLGLTTAQFSGGDASGDILSGFENIIGSSQADVLIGDANANRLTGGAGDDLLIGLGGADQLIGGDGIDTADYDASAAAVNVNLTTGIGSGGDAQGDTLTTIENVIGSAFDDTLTGDANANTLMGIDGNDLLQGRGGADIIDGGDGIDTATYVNSDAAVTVNLSSGVNTGGDAQGDTLVNIENLTGSSYDDTLTGDENANVIVGGIGDDVLAGLGGADTLDGGTGSDTADYSASMQAVNINLATGVVSGGDAQGDTLISIENVIGTIFGDTLTAAAAGSRLDGRGGDDVLFGGVGQDLIDGGTGNDTVSYANSSQAVTVNLLTGMNVGGYADDDILIDIENVTGSANDDSLTGDNSANILTGGAGNDTLAGRGGADNLIGGAGLDTADYSASASGVVVNLAQGIGSGGDAQGDTLSEIENITGSGFADTLTGNTDANVLRGGAGDDVLAGLGGADTLDGGAGTNTADYSASSEGVYVNLSNVIRDPNGVSVGAYSGLSGDAEGDTYVNIQNITGSAYADYLVAATGGSTLMGGGGNDSLFSGAGSDALNGGTGSDWANYRFSTGAVTINLSNGDAFGGYANGDTLTSIENIAGTNYADTLSGNAQDNAISGGTGNDVIEGLAGADTLDGEGGVDTVSYANSSAAVTVDLRLATAQVSTGDASGDILANFENILGSNYADLLTGNSAVNVLTGGLGDDILAGLGGADTLDGGAGSDWADYSGSLAGVTVDLNLTTGQVSTGDASGDVLTSIENVIGTDFADTLTALAAGSHIQSGNDDDTVIAGAGTDTLDGGAGDDTVSYENSTAGVTVDLKLATAQTSAGDANGDILTNFENVTGSSFDDVLMAIVSAAGSKGSILLGGEGNDRLVAGAGNDTFDGGNGDNTVDYSLSDAAVTVNISSTNGSFANAGLGAGGFAAGDTYANIQNVIGSAYADYIYANNAGGSVTAGLGNDTIVAGAGRDVVDGGAGVDQINYLWSNAAVTVNLATGLASGGYAASDVLTNIEDIVGSIYNDILTGNASANTIRGGDGNDTIDGGLGNDILEGGNGSDTLSYASATSAVRLLPNYYTWTWPSGVQTQTFLAYNTVGAGSDTTSGFENITGSNYSDIINLAYGGNNVSAGSGSDLVYANGATNSLDGGADVDTLSFSNNNGWGGVTVDLSINATTRAWGGGAQSDYYTGFENVIGSAYADFITGDSGANAITGGTGNDTLKGGAGNDVLFGGDGDDTLIGGTGADALIGGNGTDTASWVGSSAGVNANLDTGIAYGGDAGALGSATAYTNASLAAGFGFSEGTGSTSDAFNNNAIKATLYGGATWATGQSGHGQALDFNGVNGTYAKVGNIQASDSFTVAVSFNLDTLNGSLGSQGVWKLGNSTTNYFTWLRVNNNGSLTWEVRGDIAGAVTPAQSTASITSAAGLVSVDGWLNVSVTYQAGRMTMYVNGEVVGQTDSSILLPTSLIWNNNALGYDYRSNCVMDGQMDDFAVFTSALTQAEVKQLATSTSGLENAGLVTDTLSGIENLTGTSYADTLTGDSNANVLDGGAGNDTLNGGDGDDTLIGGAGADVLNGGLGSDTASYFGSTAGVTVNLSNNTTSGGDAAGDTLSSIENLRGSFYNDTLTGVDTGSTLVGGAGNDVIVGGAGNDVIKGDDDLSKLVTYATAATNLIVNGNFEAYSTARYSNATVSGGMGTGWQTSTGQIHISDSVYLANGSAENQSFRMVNTTGGTEAWQTLSTTAGETYLLQFNFAGMNNTALLLGVYVNDVQIGNVVNGAYTNNWGTVDYLFTGTGSDKVEFRLLGTSGDLLLDDVVVTAVGGHDNISGGAGDDTIDGGFGNDLIDGGDGADLITGGFGNDTVSGGEGDDRIIGGDGNDTLNGGNGDDIVSGGAGNDIVNGGAGNDILKGDTGNLIVVEAAETFSSGTDGWTGTTTMNRNDTGDAYLGQIGGSGSNAVVNQTVSKTFTLPSAQEMIQIEMDVLKLDSMDGGENLSIFVNGQIVANVNKNGSVQVVAAGVEVSSTVIGTGLDIFTTSATWTDDVYHVIVKVPTTATTITVGFGSNANEGINNESWGIDNFSLKAGEIGADGSAGDDIITGGAGDDTIDGGGGTDTAVYSGNRSAYSVTYDAGITTYSLSGTDGNDTVTNVERFKFDDGTLTAAKLITGVAVNVASNTIAEGSAAGAVAAVLSGLAGSSQTYAITGGTNAALFEISGNNIVLKSGASLAYSDGATRTVQVTATADDGSTHIQNVTINVDNVAPTISTGSLAATEGQTAVGNVVASDPSGSSVLRWSISGTDSNLFNIDTNTGALTFKNAPSSSNPQDSGADNVYDLTVAVTDGTVTTTRALQVSLNNVAPTITSGSTFNAAENGTTVATMTATDPGSPTLTWTILGGADAALFNIDALTGVLTFKNAPNFEAPADAGADNGYDVTVQVSDGSLTSSQAVHVTVTNVNEAPVITSAATYNTTENSTAVGTMTSTDQDAGATATWSIVGGADASKFTINASTGVLTFVSAPDYETPTDNGADNVYDVTVQVSDGTLTTQKAVAVTVTNTNDAPVITSAATFNAAENGTAVATMTSTDQDAGATATWSIVGGADASKFAIDANTGVLTFVSAPDYEAPTDSGANNVYDVTVQVSDGTLTTQKAVAVTVTNVNEAPVITSATSFTTNENGTAVSTMTASDVDAGTTFAWSITGGADASKFTINASTGALTFVS